MSFKHKAAVTALVAMFSGPHFSICTLINIADAFGVKTFMRSNDYYTLNLLHCMKWADMPEGLALETKLEVCRVMGIDVMEIPALRLIAA